ncbi:S-layer homology domain-containing protein [Halanaerobium praevalens]|uniref:S-layer domain-containing protein n=1 Tax=Halanaerobium praevalens (strain ATCC 33744 / DSM 2228 / GSL) TaxID=572479 RepID=E3DRC7_HALPG|nr:S-layer homology domain-containing protein [Halanaerobium praevalens]ADO78059.1 S-layer domain-containing protein [Halanaerobium praevalens DSM 2228]
MKKLTITIALMLVVALAMPAFGASFSDVPASHWSYNAINKLVAAGIVEGYPDGEYKGDKSMTRYEMAVMVSRALDNIVDEMDAMGQGLTTGQAEDVTAIVKSLMEKNTNESLSDAQAEEVADIVDALTFELRAELKVLGADVEALGKDVDELAAKVDAMDVPEDNIEFGAEFKTTFEVANYGDDKEKANTVALWADGDALDIAAPEKGTDKDGKDIYKSEDDSDFPAEKRFEQEFDFNINGNLGEAKFNLDVDTITNVFASEDTIFDENYPGLDDDYHYSPEDEDTFLMDSALLEVTYHDYGFRMGDFADYHMEKYLTDEEDMEGLEATYTYNDIDFMATVLGDDDDTTADYYGMTAHKAMTFGNLTGKVYQVRGQGFTKDNSVDSTYVALELTDVEVTEALTMGGELAFNDWSSDKDIDVVKDDSANDIYFMVNGDFAATEALTINGMIETVGSEFYAINDDLAGTDEGESVDKTLNNVDYDKYMLGAEYIVNEMNTVNGSIELVNPGSDNYTNDAEDKYEYAVGWENVYGKFTNNVDVTITNNDGFEDDHDITLIELGTEYAWNETTTLGAALVNKDEEKTDGDVINYNYLKATMDKELADNMTWNTELKYITGEVNEKDDGSGNMNDGEGNALTTSLTVSF